MRILYSGLTFQEGKESIIRRLSYYSRLWILFIDDFCISRYFEGGIKILYQLLKSRVNLHYQIVFNSSMNSVIGASGSAMTLNVLEIWMVSVDALQPDLPLRLSNFETLPDDQHCVELYNRGPAPEPPRFIAWGFRKRVMLCALAAKKYVPGLKMAADYDLLWPGIMSLHDRKLCL